MQHILCLGDSYTIGELVPFHQNFPNQTVQILRNEGFDFASPEIIAKTAWTTDELQAAIDNYTFNEKYDFVTLIIGVNNQYRGRNADEFKIEFDHLLEFAIKKSGNNPKNVIVISIPDWGVTPFAKEKDAQKIKNEIDEFNSICQQQSSKRNAHFIDITTEQRIDGNNTLYLASDLLHPNELEYKKWATKIAQYILSNLV